MADTKLSALTALTQPSLNSSDEFYVAHSSSSYSIERSELDKQWVQTSLANAANGYAALDSSGNFDAKVIILNDTAAHLASVVLEAGRMAWSTDTQELFVGDGSTAVSGLTPTNPAPILSAPLGFQQIQTTGTNAPTGLAIVGNGTGSAGLLVGSDYSSGNGGIGIFRAGTMQHQLDGGGGASFDLTAANGGILSDGNGNLAVGGNLALGSQATSVTADTDVTSSFVVCSGTTTAPKLPPVANGGIVTIKNMGSGNCVVKQNSGDSGSKIVPTGTTTAASTLTLASGAQALFFSDGTKSYQIA